MDRSRFEKSRLDRALINMELASKGDWKLIATARMNSDHRGILLVDINLKWGAKPFRVFNFWLKVESLTKLVEEKCKGSVLQGNAQALIRKIRNIIEEWNSGTNGNVYKKIEELELKLAELEDTSVQGMELDICKLELEEQYL